MCPKLRSLREERVEPSASAFHVESGERGRESPELCQKRTPMADGGCASSKRSLKEHEERWGRARCAERGPIWWSAPWGPAQEADGDLGEAPNITRRTSMLYSHPGELLRDAALGEAPELKAAIVGEPNRVEVERTMNKTPLVEVSEACACFLKKRCDEAEGE